MTGSAQGPLGRVRRPGGIPKPSEGSERFDRAYYQQFYVRQPVHSAAQVAHLAEGVWSLSRWWGIRVRSLLEVGAGPGYWRRWARMMHPTIRVDTVDISAHACSTYGHSQRDISQWSPARPYDLVVCQGVLQYLDRRSAASAVSNLALATRSVLYLEVPTQSDRDEVLDNSASDLAVHWRSGSWYRSQLEQHFVSAGSGIWLTHGTVSLYELELGIRNQR